jgi:hypothetical protein
MLISLPLLLLPLATLPMKSAFAETVGIERALELLAKSVAVDGKCKVLSAAERDELSRYASRAEISGAEKTSVEHTRAALETGKRAGLATVCNNQSRADVKDTLEAAREAIKTVAQNDTLTVPDTKVTSQKPVINGQKPTSVAISTNPGKPAAPNKLSAYSRVTEAYFLERRCSYLTRQQIMSFYKAVVRNHLAAIARFGKAAVSSARRSAEVNANSQSCNGAGEARVKAGYAEMASR